LIFDECSSASTWRCGAREYFGVQADLRPCRGGGSFSDRRGLRSPDLMKRFRDDRPADICFARGTNSLTR
jgi:glutamate-1-semialdehyde 2,1-aminomutase